MSAGAILSSPKFGATHTYSQTLTASHRDVLEALGVQVKSFPRKHLFRSRNEGVVQERTEELSEFLTNVMLPNIAENAVAEFLELEKVRDLLPSKSVY